MSAIIRTLQFLRLADADGNLSLTNLGVIAAFANLFVSDTGPITDLGPVLAALANYAHKRQVLGKSEQARLQVAIDSVVSATAQRPAGLVDAHGTPRP